MTTLIKNATYLAGDYSGWREGDILICEGKIAALGTMEAGRLSDCEVIDARSKLVIPGLINAHAHSYTGYLKGTIDNVPLDIYMLYAIAGGSFRSPREIYVSTMVEALQMMKTGTTAVLDHFSQRPVQAMEGLDAAAQAFTDAGMRANIATMFADLSFFDTVPMQPGELPAELAPGAGKPASQTPEDYIAVTEAAFRKYNTADSLIRVTLGTDGPQRCSRRLLELTRDLEEKTHMGWHTHVLEAKTQAIVSHSLYGMGLIEYMDRIGMINERTSLVHYIWVSEKERQIVRERGATVVHCPSSALHLGSGIAPVDKMLEEGMHVALGTDGGNCGNLSMFERIRLAAMLHDVGQPDYEKWISAQQALRLDYEGGARAMMLQDRIGRIKPGMEADLAVIDINNILWQPVGNPTRQLVYGESGSNVETLFVSGRKVIDHGKSTLVNEEEIIAEAREIAARLKKDGAGAMQMVEKQVPYFRQMYMREIRRDIGMNRFARPLD